MTITASKLRQDVYRILDRVLESGVPVEIERRGQRLQIAPSERSTRLERLKPRRFLRTHPDRLVHIDWSKEWRP
jgi:antitoxin (DNA-binding transcriptional repressor) of toxin-antitoxin stability system